MGIYRLLLVVFCFLDFHIAPGAGLLAGLNSKYEPAPSISDSERCIRDGGSCVYYNCPIFAKILGTCYDGEAKCCA